MNLQYVLWFLASLVISLGLFAFMNREKKGVLVQCLLMGTLGTLLGLVCAKLVYYLAMIDFMVMQGWLKSLVDVTMGTFSYYGGVAGFCLGVVLSARLAHHKPMELLNAFAPAGLLLAALARFGEVMLEGEVLAGGFLENFFGYERWGRCIGKDMDFLIVGGFAKENATLLVQCRE